MSILLAPPPVAPQTGPKQGIFKKQSMFPQEELREAQIHWDERLLLSPPRHLAALPQSPYNAKSQGADPAGSMRPPEAVEKGDDNQNTQNYRFL